MNARLVIAAALSLTAITAVRARAQAADAQSLYNDNCRKCHGVKGTPPKTMKEKFPKIATFDAAFVASHSADSIVKILTKGKNEDMKSFKDKLTSAQMADVAAYVRELSAKKAP
ncbi:MAG TPA: cytochrome c [Gemmatimonadaceae bacterium]|nr:cytochrome c [Gemmatimonadaceae bacterium]